MPFASLKEVYGDDFVTITENTTTDNTPINSYNSIYNINNARKDNLQESSDQNKEVESFVSNYSTKLENYEDLDELYKEEETEDSVLESFQNSTEDSNGCGHLIKHLANCPKCRLYLEKYFGKQESIQRYIAKKREDQFLDIAIYIVSGIFLLFLLDIFVRLGKFLK